MGAYYNEFDAKAAAWLRELIRCNLIAPGDVDERSIVEVRPDDLRGYEQCHFFAGIGGWSYALRLAGWPDDRPVWTGSCPCQPFSTAGKQRGAEDERHLWPAFFHLIRECRPAIVFGEQVAGAAGFAWWDHVAADLESAGYAAAAANLGAHTAGAPHIRQRLYWVAHAGGAECGQGRTGWHGAVAERAHDEFAGRGATGSVADAQYRGGHDGGGLLWGGDKESEWGKKAERRKSRIVPETYGYVGELADASKQGRQGFSWDGVDGHEPGRERKEAAGFTGAASPWRELEWLPCSDGKARPTQPGLFPLASGVPARVGRLRGYGNAIVPQVAELWIRAVRECL